jgi:hypothetical protein
MYIVTHQSNFIFCSVLATKLDRLDREHWYPKNDLFTLKAEIFPQKFPKRISGISISGSMQTHT